MYLIDLCHMDLFEEEGLKDEGFLLGLTNVIGLIRDLDQDNTQKSEPYNEGNMLI